MVGGRHVVVAGGRVVGGACVVVVGGACVVVGGACVVVGGACVVVGGACVVVGGGAVPVVVGDAVVACLVVLVGGVAVVSGVEPAALVAALLSWAKKTASGDKDIKRFLSWLNKCGGNSRETSRTNRSRARPGCRASVPGKNANYAG